MKIAQVSPLYESVPPKFYGGTERVVSYLTEALVKSGHEVTLFASGDSKTRARLIPITQRSLRLENSIDTMAPHVLQLRRVLEMAGQFDIIHFHTDYFHFPVSKLCAYTHLTTLHGRLDMPELKALYNEFNDVPVTSISVAQRKPLSRANWVGNVYHGVPEDLYEPGSGKGGYAAFVGRISPEKRVDRAIEIAEKAGLPIKIAAKIDKNDREYFESIKHLFQLPHVEFIGEIGEDVKSEFLGNAAMLLFPIDWPEPFGMVMIESMACGTPIVAYGLGSVPEIIEPGKSGFIVSSIEEAVNAVKRIAEISRKDCRQVFMDRFTDKLMADEYVTLYRRLIEENRQTNFPPLNQGQSTAMRNVLSA